MKRVQRECGSVRAECEEGACEEGPEEVWKCEEGACEEGPEEVWKCEVGGCEEGPEGGWSVKRVQREGGV